MFFNILAFFFCTSLIVSSQVLPSNHGAALNQTQNDFSDRATTFDAIDEDRIFVVRDNTIQVFLKNDLSSGHQATFTFNKSLFKVGHCDSNAMVLVYRESVQQIHYGSSFV